MIAIFTPSNIVHILAVPGLVSSVADSLVSDT